MFRLISVILLLGGAAALVFGGMRYLETPNAPALEAEPPAIDIPEQPAPPVEPLEKATPDPQAFRVKPPSLDGDVFGVATSTADIMAKLKSVPIAHETPRKAKFGRPFEVTVAVDATGDESAADALPGRGTIVESTAQISASVQATVSGEMFDIEPITPIVQRISPLTENVWRWKVTPQATGEQSLVIELFALAGDEALPIQTFRDEIDVEVSRVGQVIAVANSVSPVAMVLGGIGSLLAGLFGVARFFRGS